jgi:hypothetical protein
MITFYFNATVLNDNGSTIEEYQYHYMFLVSYCP